MSNLFDLTDKVAIITGSSRGIGLAIAQRYAEAGAKVVLSSRKQPVLDDIAAEMKSKGYDVLAVAAHNGDKAALQNLVQQTVDAYGRVDILVNNAATNPHFGPIMDSEDSMWQKTIEVNIMGNFWLSQAAVRVMQQHGGGKIINVASVNGLRPGTFQGIYSMTKAAVISLTKTLAMELASDNIQVNAIAPGLIKTKFAQAIWENDMLLEGVVNRTPAGRIGEPDEIAGIAVYLASPASSFTTGQVFVVDGGVTIPMI
ncbi:MAG: short-chain dehydrogenase [Phototrophicales bacterium]|nr:MAG: short-chain dehydrogenase [Phototrophicales bacterium]RMG76316.1 MAG: glucose 1-dehydrogenase [Chloroflexota bacterium]